MTVWTRGVPRVGASLGEAAPEKKTYDYGRPGHDEVKRSVDEFLTAFEAFKEANDERLKELERKSSADVVSEEKVERINAALDLHQRKVDELALKLARPALDGQGQPPQLRSAHQKAFHGYVRKGDERELRALEAKALSVQSDPDGGFLVPAETEGMIDRVVAQISPIRSIAGFRQISSGSFKKPITTAGVGAGWVGETDVRPETAAPTLSELEFPTMELYAMPAATSSLLEDAAIDVDQWLAEEVQTAFAEQEGAAFVNGDGVKKPKGFLTYPTVADASYAWGKLGYLVTGASGAFAATDPSDILVDLVYTLKAGYRANAHFVMNRKTQAVIRKMKDDTDNYIWSPGLAAGQPPTLLNYPVIEAEDMPTIAANKFSVAFGDFRRGYLVVDRVGVRVLRDPYSAKPYVLFYTTKRVGGGVQNFEAIKLLKFGSS